MNIPIAAEAIYHIGSFPVTNAYVNSCIVTVGLVVFSFLFSRVIKKKPGILQTSVESFLEFLLGYFDQVTGSREKSRKFLPLVGSLFLFILLSNWLGLLPGTGTLGVWEMMEGKLELVPILRSANSDLNLTAAMAVASVISSHIIGMFALGFFAHWGKFIQIGKIWSALKSLKPINLMTAVVEFGVGLLELVSEVAKILSLSLRLFGNIFAGEVLLTVISSLVAWFMPLPFMALELIVGVVQATVFAMLTLVYLTTATTSHEAHDEKHSEHAHVPEQLPATTH